MASALVRVSPATHAILRRLARDRRESMQAVLESAVEELRRRRFLEEVNAAYGVLRAHDVAWGELRDELGAWDATLADGLPPEPAPPAPRAARPRKRSARRR
jgi:hypothetical protein